MRCGVRAAVINYQGCRHKVKIVVYQVKTPTGFLWIDHIHLNAFWCSVHTLTIHREKENWSFRFPLIYCRMNTNNHHILYMDVVRLYEFTAPKSENGMWIETFPGSFHCPVSFICSFVQMENSLFSIDLNHTERCSMFLPFVARHQTHAHAHIELSHSSAPLMTIIEIYSVCVRTLKE